MKRRGRLILVLAMASALSTVARGQDRPTFRAGAAAIAVDVSVADGRRVVAGLRAEDFELRDNGVLQSIAATALGAIPFDVTLVVDTSGSLDKQTLDQFKLDIAAIAKMLSPEDRFRLVTFATRGTDAFGWQPGAVAPPLGKMAAGGATAFYETLGAVLARRTTPGRRHLVVAMSDGFDNVSVLDERDLKHLAGVGDAVLHIILRREPTAVFKRAWGWVPYFGAGDTGSLKTTAESTGGRLRQVNPKASLLEEFQAALAEFRTSYLLWYTPTGVASDGWHAIDVRVTRGKYEVRARRGYQAGGQQ